MKRWTVSLAALLAAVAVTALMGLSFLGSFPWSDGLIH